MGPFLRISVNSCINICRSNLLLVSMQHLKAMIRLGLFQGIKQKIAMITSKFLFPICHVQIFLD